MSLFPGERTALWRTRTRTALSWLVLAAGSPALLSACDDDHKDPPEVDASVDPIGNDASVPVEDSSVPQPEDAGVDAQTPDPLDAGGDGSPDMDGSVPEQDASVPDAAVPDAGPALAPLLRHPLQLRDRDLAVKALRLLGSSAVGAEGSCSTCHNMGRSTLSRWRRLTNDTTERCLGNTSLSDAESIDQILLCLRNWDENFTPGALGIYSAAAHLPWFEFAFEHRSDASDNWRDVHDRFVAQAGMPRAGTRFTQEQFDVVAEWFARGIPMYRDLVPPDQGTATCSTSISPQMLAHIDQMATGGWRAKNHEDGMLMYGCQTGQAGLSCLSDHALAKDTDYGATWDAAGSNIRVLFDNSQAGSSYWTRSSADGRYLASGGAAPNQDPEGGSFLGAKIIDLARGVYIPLDGMYDPGFFPDNSGFVMQAGGGALMCDQSLLATNPTSIDGSQAQCGYFSVEHIGIYEQLGKTVGGSDYWVAAGQFAADDGGSVGQNPDAPFGDDSQVTLTPMINEGNRFRDGNPAYLPTRDQGDPSISASGTLLITRVKGDEVEDDWGGFSAKQNGYSIQRIVTGRDGDQLTATLEPMARVCVNGGKPMLSHDERYMVVHQYVTEESFADLGFTSANDPEFRRYVDAGTSNLVLIDLKSGEKRRITNMQPGQKALFPHFRTDGWIYFIVRFEGHEIIVANDAALVWEAAAR